jgi:hypothetical protein
MRNISALFQNTFFFFLLLFSFLLFFFFLLLFFFLFFLLFFFFLFFFFFFLIDATTVSFGPLYNCLLHVSALHCHPQGAFLVSSERCSIEEQSIECCVWACCV